MSAIAAIHVARKQLGLDDDTARDLYERATGKRSLRAMTSAEQGAVVAALKQQGFKPSSGGRRKALEGRFAKKLQALWIAGWNLGIVRNRDDAALLAFVKRQTGVDHTRFLHHPEDAARAIEALKGWITREARVHWTVQADEEPWAKQVGFQIALAQHLILHPDRSQSPMLADEIRDIAGKWPQELTSERDWQPVMNELGRRIREGQST